MSGSKLHSIGGRLPAVILIMAAGAAVLIADYSSRLEAQRNIVYEKANTTLSALTAGIRAQSRMGRYRAERLQTIFEELTRTPGIMAVTLFDPAGAQVATAGSWSAAMSVGPGESKWLPTGFVKAMAVDFGGHSGGRGGPAWLDNAASEDSAWRTGNYSLAVAVDGSDFHRASNTELIRFGVACGLFALALSGALYAFHTWSKQRALEMEVALSVAQLAQQAEIAQLGAGLAHETKNPLGIVRGFAQEILVDLEAPRAVRNIAATIVDEVDRTVRNINGFLELARPKEIRLTDLNAITFFEQLRPIFDAEAHGKITIEYRVANIILRADDDMFRRVLLNLVSNAVKACESHDRVVISLTADATTWELVVADTGCGIAEDDLTQILAPYFTRFTGGTGLGLTIVNQIVAAHGWKLTIESWRDGGAKQGRKELSKSGTRIMIRGSRATNSPNRTDASPPK